MLPLAVPVKDCYRPAAEHCAQEVSVGCPVSVVNRLFCGGRWLDGWVGSGKGCIDPVREGLGISQSPGIREAGH